jgi:Xaa-Pro aminopeptidase
VTFTSAEYAERHERLRALLRERNLDAVIAYATPKLQANVRWLARYFVRFTGMQTRPDSSYFMFGSCAVLFPVDGEPVLLTDQPWDLVRAREESLFPDVIGTEDLGTDLASLINSRGIQRVAIDNWFVFPAVHYLTLRERCPAVDFRGEYFLSELRRVKSREEIALLRRAEQIADSAVQAGLARVVEGATEYEVALAAESTMRELGDIETAASIIASAGVNTATASSLPSRDKRLERGELFLLDLAPRFEGYPGDISRMRVVGDLSDAAPLHRRAHDVSVLMNEEVRRAIRPGVQPKDLHALALQVAEAEGMGEYRRGVDLLGHGLGMDIHGMPDYYYDASSLTAGEVLTVEPGLIIPGQLGTRIEDVVLVTADGCETLSTTPRTLEAIPVRA